MVVLAIGVGYILCGRLRSASLSMLFFFQFPIDPEKRRSERKNNETKTAFKFPIELAALGRVKQLKHEAIWWLVGKTF